MDLILLRHADAERQAPSDFERRLTEKGRDQSRRVGAYLAACAGRIDRILTSPLVRARETADLVQEAVASKSGVVEEERLASGMRPDDGCRLVADLGDDAEGVVLVGHEPDFSGLLAYLVGMDDSGCIAFKKAACAFLEVERPRRGGAVLRGFVPPKLLPSAGSAG